MVAALSTLLVGANADAVAVENKSTYEWEWRRVDAAATLTRAFVSLCVSSSFEPRGLLHDVTLMLCALVSLPAAVEALADCAALADDVPQRVLNNVRRSVGRARLRVRRPRCDRFGRPVSNC